MILNELFDSPVPFTFDGKEGQFEIDGQRYGVVIQNTSWKSEVEADVSFFGYNQRGHQTIDLTRNGNELKVFSTVIEMVRQYVAKVKPHKIIFSAQLTEPSRVKLYNRMVRTFNQGWKIRTVEYEREKVYTMTRVDPYDPD